MSTRPQQTLTDEQQSRLLTYLSKHKPRVEVAAHLMLRFGLRLAEASAAEWSWLRDLESDMPILDIPAIATKTRTARSLPITNGEKLYFIELRQRQQLFFPSTPPSSWPLVLSRWSRGPSHRYVQRTISLAGQNLFSIPLRCHTLRHTFATDLLRVTNVRTVQIALGHRSIRSTQVYTHPSIADLARALSRLTAIEKEPPR